MAKKPKVITPNKGGLSKKLKGLPTLADFRAAGIQLPMTGTYEFNLILKRLTSQVEGLYTPHQVKVFLAKASHSFHATPDKGKSTRQCLSDESFTPDRNCREMGRSRQIGDGNQNRVKTYQ